MADVIALRSTKLLLAGAGNVDGTAESLDHAVNTWRTKTSTIDIYTWSHQ